MKTPSFTILLLHCGGQILLPLHSSPPLLFITLLTTPSIKGQVTFGEGLLGFKRNPLLFGLIFPPPLSLYSPFLEGQIRTGVELYEPHRGPLPRSHPLPAFFFLYFLLCSSKSLRENKRLVRWARSHVALEGRTATRSAAKVLCVTDSGLFYFPPAPEFCSRCFF